MSTQHRLLISAAECPWASARQLAVHARTLTADASGLCDELVSQGLMQRAEIGLSRYPSAMYAPTDAGIAQLSESLRTPAARLLQRVELNEQRFWALRGGWEVSLEVNAMCAHTATSLEPETVRWQTLVERRFRKAPLFLHGRLAVECKDGIRTYYLLNEREDGAIWSWYGYFKYFTIWARRIEGSGEFPSLLVVTTRPFRAEALLALNRMAGGQVAMFATCDRAQALAQGLARVRWYVMLSDTRLTEAAPFAAKPTDSGEVATKVHAVRYLQVQQPGLQRQSASDRNLPRRATATFDGLPVALQRLPDMDHLDDAHYRLLRFIVEHPVCPTSTIVAFVDKPVDKITAHLLVLHSLGFVEQVNTAQRDRRWIVKNEPSRDDLATSQYVLWRHLKTHPLSYVADISRVLQLTPAEAQTHIDALETAGWITCAETSPEHALWAATDLAVSLFGHRTLQRPDKLVRRHGFFRADHSRRIQHTRAVYGFFEAMRRNCLRLSAASRRYDAPDVGLNEGDIAWCELGTFESEMMASDWYDVVGKTYLWRPDGYGVLRAGAAFTPFWLEMDGNPQTRSRREVNAWERKLGALCDYYTSGRWKLKSRGFPQLLIVSSLDKRLKSLILDMLYAASRSRDMNLPRVLVTSHQALNQQGPLGRIWFPIEPNIQAQHATYAFPGVEPQKIVQSLMPRRRNLLDDLVAAEALGLLE